MYCFHIKVFAVTASFRIPESHTFQQSLPLPPPTTLTGLMGAAMGLSFESAVGFRESNGLRFGVVGTHRGVFKDLWKYRKIKSKAIITDVLLREYLTDLEMSLYIASESRLSVNQVRESFLSPCYALTAGNSDDLLKIINVGEIIDINEIPVADFQQTILPGNHVNNYSPLADLENLPITESIRAPQVYLLPTAFAFKGKERRISCREHFTFVGSSVILEKPIPGIRINDESVVLL
ncbi:CRISPR-associated protein Cas5 [Desulfococcaceae bacterium HSG9]|nr:CRISPR-associated protein Cas5 [Desulfococcaceae bacterium HSG9]